jgi:hypothetical protein
MILVWNNTDSFKRHLEDMRLFRQTHHDIRKTETGMLKDMALLFDVQPPRETGLIKRITDIRGKIVFVPIWEMTLPRGSQN